MRKLTLAIALIVPMLGHAAWADAAQRDRCLDSLLTDGLAEQLDDGRFALPA